MPSQSHTPSPAPSLSSSTSSKLPKFLRTPGSTTRDRAKSVAEASTTSLTSTSSEGSAKAKKSRFLSRRSADVGDRDSRPATPAVEVEEAPIIVEPVAIPRPRSMSPSSPSSPSSPRHISLYANTQSSSARLSDLPTRLSGWFSHTFSSSTTDLSLPSLIASTSHSNSFNPALSTSSTASTSPRRSGIGASALLAAAKHGKGHLDKAMRYLLDSDATPDKCVDPIWILGVKHVGYEPPPPQPTQPQSLNSSTRSLRSSISGSTVASEATLRPRDRDRDKDKEPKPQWPPEFYADFTSRVWLTYRSHFPPIRDVRLADLDGDFALSSRHYPESVHKKGWGWGGEKGWTSDSGWGCMLRTGQSLLANALVFLHLGRDWRRPPYAVHTADYAMYVQILTWFLDTPSPDAPFSVHRMALAGKELGKDVGQWFGPSTAAGAIKTLVHAFPESGLGVAVATDGVLYQSDVFTASHTGSGSVRSPRRHAKAQGGKWGDRPVLLLIGVRLGLDGVNPIYYETIKWLTIKQMLYTFPQSVGIAGGRPSSSYYFVGSQADNLFYLDPHHARQAVTLRVPPMPYIEPEESDSGYNRPEQRSPPPGRERDRLSPSPSPSPSPSSMRTASSTFSYHAPLSPSPLQHQFSSASGESDGAPSVSVSGDSEAGEPSRGKAGKRHTQHVKAHSTTAAAPSRSSSMRNHQSHQGYAHAHHAQAAASSASPSPSGSPARFRSASVSHSPAPSAHAYAHAHAPHSDSGAMHESDLRPVSPPSVAMSMSRSTSGSTSTSVSALGLDVMQEHYATAYPPLELKTFHCERVRKMPLSGLDPSMLIGFLCKDEEEWRDLRRRVAGLPRTVFSVQEEPPTWPSDSDDNMGLESISEPDPEDLLMDMDMEDEDQDQDRDDDGDADRDVDADDAQEGDESDEGDADLDEERFTHARSASASTSSASGSGYRGDGGRATSEEVDTEEDPVDPITPLPNSRFAINAPLPPPTERAKKERKRGHNRGVPSLSPPPPPFEEGDIEDDWVDPSIPTPIPSKPPSSISTSTSSSKVPEVINVGTPKTPKKSRKGREVPVPVPLVKAPSSNRSQHQHQHQQQEHFPFPVSQRTPDADDWETSPTRVEEARPRHVSIKGGGGKERRMHTARARDGGRTQSGGVKGILTDD
ncbi:hypothetical protein H0H92_010613 [Tricholoma furcatifolium]|nr:hypothetical protein H0H92_010613 [Tricholoma furcatifolium]